MKFNWQPTSFQEVVNRVHSPGLVKSAMMQAIHRVGSLSCPSPRWDPDGTYRVGPAAGGMEIQRLDPATRQWQPADLQPDPPPIVAAHPSQRVRVQLADGSVVDATVISLDDSQFPCVVTVSTDDGTEHDITVGIGWPPGT